LVNGIGAAIGPFTISLFLAKFGMVYFFPIIGVSFLLITLYGIWRTQMRAAVPMEQQNDYVQMPPRPTTISMAITEESHAILKEMEGQK